MNYYIEEVHNKRNQIVGYTAVQSVKYKKDLPKNCTIINLGTIPYDEYLNNRRDFYISGNNLLRVER